MPNAPAPSIGMRAASRADGSPYLTGVVNEDLHVPAGSTLDLRRIRADGEGTDPTHALLIVPPRTPWAPTKAERARAAESRLDGSALRHDQRDAIEEHP